MQTCCHHHQTRSPSQISSCLSQSNTCCNSRELTDGVVFELKKRVIELEQKEISYIQLNQRYKQLQSLNDSITEEKFRFQTEIKNLKENFNKQILGLRDENENLQMALNDKLEINIKMAQDKENIETLLNRHIDKSKEQNSTIEQSMLRLNKTIEEKNQLEIIIQSLKDINTFLNRDISKMNEDNNFLNEVLKEKESNAIALKEQKDNLTQQNNELSVNYQLAIDKIRQMETLINTNQSEIIKNKNKITLLQSDLYDYHTENDCLKKEVNVLKSTLQNERNTRNACEKELDYLNKTMNEFTQELNLFQDQLKNEQIINQRHFEDKAGLKIDIDKLKRNTKVLIKQNETLISVIEEIIIEDEGNKQELNRKERIEYLIHENRLLLKKSMNDNKINRLNNIDGNNYLNSKRQYHNHNHNRRSLSKNNTVKTRTCAKEQLIYN